MERFVIIVNSFQPLTITTIHFILDVAAVLDPPLLKWSYLYLSITWLHGYDITSTRREMATRLLSKKYICSRHLVSVAPPKKNIWVFVKIRALCANATLRRVTPDILSKKCIYCPRLVIIISLEVNYNNVLLNVEKLLCGQYFL